MNVLLPDSRCCCEIVQLFARQHIHVSPSGGTQAKRLEEKVTEPWGARPNKSHPTIRLAFKH
jgi:hypothetical protein